VNLGLVGVAALWLHRRDHRRAGLFVAVAGALAVAIRGYVVPYTPRFAPKLVAALPVPTGHFETGPDSDIPEQVSLTATELDGETILGELAAAGAIEADGELIRPTESVDVTWHREMDRLADQSLDALAQTATATLPTVPTAEAYDDGDSQWLVVDGGLVARPVVVAELAAYRALGEAVSDRELRLAGARAFRTFLDDCPVCGTDLVQSSAVSCCGGYTDPQTAPEDLLVCPTCEQRLVTLPT
jgi:hypothetical protein